MARVSARAGRLLGIRAGAARAGALVRPAVPWVIGLSAAAVGTGYVVKQAAAFRTAANPPLQTQGVDLDGKPGWESFVTFDPRTGRTLVFGSPPSSAVGPERSQERQVSTALLVGGAVAVVALVVLVGRAK